MVARPIFVMALTFMEKTKKKILPHMKEAK